ncbi:MAG: leucine--tRNA ligase [Candidatus Falkowbacteria bacterium]|nr:leucine--tRNA ligase [Candidatus Falkowbacteria bacterium]
MYDHSQIEKKWQGKWRADKANLTEENPAKEKKYVLDMFPYPSGAGLHAGHVESYTATDIYARYLRAKGFSVLHPQGFDAFGLPAENYAIRTGIHPQQTTAEAIKNFIAQMDSLGLSYDWERSINTSDPEYYKFTQWIFLLLYKNGLAYKKEAKVNWCRSCQTVLANEQAENGVCERCGSSVIQKDLSQWFFKITDFVEDFEVSGQKIPGLLRGLDDLDWPSSTKAAQKNWIGRSEGAEIEFPIRLAGEDQPQKIKVFTTRLDTIFGCTYVVLAPEHPLIPEFSGSIKNFQIVESYLNEVKRKTDLERTDLNKDKTGVPLSGLEAINPFTGEAVQVFVADYVLGSYGTGAVMAVPAHDERDFEFAKKYRLSVKKSVKPLVREIDDSDDFEEAEENFSQVFTEDGELVDSGKFTGLQSVEARERMANWLTENNFGRRMINYRLRDWGVSRQRYWGAPIPIIYCDYCGEVPVPESDLPVVLPDDVDFRPTGESPLRYSQKFNKVLCPKCGKPAHREHDTMDTFVCSSWYYLRYADPTNKDLFASPEKLQRWLPVDLYLGGAEHTVLHLLYSRFFTKVLRKYGHLNFNEPFLKLRHQGTILGEDGNKMSKSKGNVVNPDELIKSSGADALRLYEMFLGPLEDMKPWNSQGIIGVRRFLEKVYTLAFDVPRQDDKQVLSLLHKTIRKVGQDIEEFKFNTAISAMMILVNEISDYRQKNKTWPLSLENTENFLKIFAPFAPHLAEELWEYLGNQKSIFLSPWPQFDESLLISESVNLAVQINGKLRATINLDPKLSEAEVLSLIKEDENVKKWLLDAEIVKTIFVPGRLVNLVLKNVGK